jgi:uncharacterized protein
MKKLYLIHGWGGGPTSEGWFGWLIKECKKRDIKIEIPKMPNTEKPIIKEWVGHLEKVCNVDEETYFVGHSIGCQTIMRFLEKLPNNKKIAGVGFIAGFFNLLETGWEAEDEEGVSQERAIAKPWLETPINTEKIKSHTKNILAIFSTDDPCVPVSDAKLFKERLNAKIIIKNNEEHFNTTKEIPELLEIFK